MGVIPPPSGSCYKLDIVWMLQSQSQFAKWCYQWGQLKLRVSEGNGKKCMSDFTMSVKKMFYQKWWRHFDIAANVYNDWKALWIDHGPAAYFYATLLCLGYHGSSALFMHGEEGQPKTACKFPAVSSRFLMWLAPLFPSNLPPPHY